MGIIMYPSDGTCQCQLMRPNPGLLPLVTGSKRRLKNTDGWRQPSKVELIFAVLASDARRACAARKACRAFRTARMGGTDTHLGKVVHVRPMVDLPMQLTIGPIGYRRLA
jgi:hypothetical protein